MDPKEIKDATHKNAIREWETIREASYNANTKGGDYEEILQEFLRTYFGEAFNIRTRNAIIDNGLNYTDEFTDSGNEFDVVATYRGTTPQVMFNVNDTDWVAYDGVAFVCEVKSKMTTSSLDNDLEKLSKLRKLDSNPQSRFGSGGTVNTTDQNTGETVQLTVPWQLHILVYDQSDVAVDTYQEKLYKNNEAFDMMIVMDEDRLIISPRLPANVMYGAKRGQAANLRSQGLLAFLVILSISTPHMPTVNTARTLKSILNA